MENRYNYNNEFHALYYIIETLHSQLFHKYVNISYYSCSYKLHTLNRQVNASKINELYFYLYSKIKTIQHGK